MNTDSTTPPTNPELSPNEDLSSAGPISNQRGNALIIIGVVVLLVVLGAIAYYSTSVKKQSSQTTQQSTTNLPSQSPVTSKTSTSIVLLSNAWILGTQTYSNSKADITFQYPNSFSKNEVDTVKENAAFKQKYPEVKNVPYGDFFVSFYTPEAPIEERQKSTFDWTTYDKNAMSISVDVYNNTTGTSLENFLKTHYAGVGIDGKTPVYETLKKNLVSSNIPNTNSYVYVGALGENPQKKIFFTYKNKFYIFTLQGGTGAGADYSSEAEKIFDQVIGSIKFQ